MQIPVRYTALESLHHKIYSIESELWTFGVVLWELFTFAQQMPYEMELPNFSITTLKNYLISGSRLKIPETAPYPMLFVPIIIFVMINNVVYLQTNTNVS